MKNLNTVSEEKLNGVSNEWNSLTVNQRVGALGEGVASINKEYGVYYTHLTFSQLSNEEKEIVLNAF